MWPALFYYYPYFINEKTEAQKGLHLTLAFQILLE